MTQFIKMTSIEKKKKKKKKTENEQGIAFKTTLIKNLY